MHLGRSREIPFLGGGGLFQLEAFLKEEVYFRVLLWAASMCNFLTLHHSDVICNAQCMYGIPVDTVVIGNTVTLVILVVMVTSITYITTISNNYQCYYVLTYYNCIY